MQKIPTEQEMNLNRNMVFAFILIAIFMVGWNYYYEMPRQKALQEARQKAEQAQILKQKLAKLIDAKTIAPSVTATTPAITSTDFLNRSDVIKQDERINISNAKIHGSIRVKGARLDDITLAKYKETKEKGSPEVVLMSPKGAVESNIIETGWLAGSETTKVPTSETVWTASSTELGVDKPVILTWDNGAGLIFTKIISLDKNYMFTVEHKVQNNSTQSASLFPFGLINKNAPINTHVEAEMLAHAGPLGTMEGKLTEIGYEKLREENNISFDNASGWIGVTDKYWAKLLVPASGEKFKANFQHIADAGRETFQVDYLAAEKLAKPNETISYTTMFFAGAKELSVLENYSEKYNIVLFERAIDFGWFFFLTKPMMHALEYFYSWLGNFGLAIIALTLCVKIILFPLARKSYIAMGKMKVLTPKVMEIREQHKDNKMEMNKKMMEMYQKEKVNPASGCFPILLQIPVFFALYKVFFVSIEMRHAPFFGWINDLSAPDPTSLFNLFGLLPFSPPAFLLIGAWPCLWALSMYLQQKISPPPTDPMQAKVMRMMPLLFMFLFASFPAGMVVYWTFSNIFTIAQQYYFLRRLGYKIEQA